MTEDKIIDTIKKLLSLAADKGNENEATLAMKRAQDLIAKYSIDLAQDTLPQIVEVTYTHNFKSPGLLHNLHLISNIVAGMFGCHALWFPRLDMIKIIGFKTNVEITIYAITSVVNQMLVDFRKGYREHRSLAFSDGFWGGAVIALREKYQTEVKSGQGLVLYDKAKEFIDQKYTSVAGESLKHSQHGKELGYKSGKDASLRSGVNKGNDGKLIS